MHAVTHYLLNFHTNSIYFVEADMNLNMETG